MAKIDGYFTDYDAFHRTTGNKLSHVLGIPMIVLSALGMLDRLVFAQWDLPVPVHASAGLVAWILACLFYVYLHVGLGLSMVITTGALFAAGASMSMPVLIALQVIGWVAQLVGHSVWEKKKPAFARNAVHLLIGPIYIQNYLLKLYSPRKKPAKPPRARSA